ncbi:MAG TPA: response regulator transcription factor [Tepidiformaceae bacterium]|nr:response regulator transcription factor [Tepidiformaceae bacterium]
MPASTAIRVLVLAAYPAVRAGLRAMLHEAPGITVVDERTPATLDDPTLPEADVLLAEHDGDPTELLATIDDALPGMPAVFLVDTLPAGSPTAPTAWLLRESTANELVAAIRAVEAGLAVFHPSLVPTPAPGASILDTTAPAEPLTSRELDVLRQLALGLPNKTIAFNLGISDHTVKFHVSAVLAKLGAASRTEAVMLAARRGLLPL